MFLSFLQILEIGRRVTWLIGCNGPRRSFRWKASRCTSSIWKERTFAQWEKTRSSRALQRSSETSCGNTWSCCKKVFNRYFNRQNQANNVWNRICRRGARVTLINSSYEYVRFVDVRARFGCLHRVQSSFPHPTWRWQEAHTYDARALSDAHPVDTCPQQQQLPRGWVAYLNVFPNSKGFENRSRKPRTMRQKKQRNTWNNNNKCDLYLCCCY